MSEVKNFYAPAVYEELLSRVDKLTENHKPLWGKMSVGQMLDHCAEAQAVNNGVKKLENTPWFAKVFLKGMIKKMVYSDKPFPQSVGTHPQYLQTTPKEFNATKKALLQSLDYARQHPEKVVEHELFGSNKMYDSGFVFYKHLDHHLRQFGV